MSNRTWLYVGLRHAHIGGPESGTAHLGGRCVPMVGSCPLGSSSASTMVMAPMLAATARPMDPVSPMLGVLKVAIF